MIKRFIAAAMIFTAGFAFSSAMNGKSLSSFAKGLLARPDSPTITTQGALRDSPQQWEYRVVTSAKDTGFLGGTKGNVDGELNQLGAQGFEICEMTQSSSNAGYYLTIVLRRPRQ